MKVYPKKEKKAFQPMFKNGVLNADASALVSKKLNPANNMSAEEFSKSKYATMSKSDFEEERQRDAMNSKSW